MTQSTDLLTGNGARELVHRMGEAASNLLTALAPHQRRQAHFSFPAQEARTDWHFTPVARGGLPFANMDRHQRRKAEQLIATGLSRSGYVTASTIVGLEMTLDFKEGWTWPDTGRNGQLYYVSIFGQPSDTDAWGWRFEGHHISLNFTIVKGQIVAPTPTFFGSNPAEMPLSAVASLRPLAGVEDLARDLIHSLDEGQRAAVILAPTAPSDMVTSNHRQIAEGQLHLGETAIEQWREAAGLEHSHIDALRYSNHPKGLAAASMNGGQREILQALIGEYIHRMPDELAEIEAARLHKTGIEQVHFAWAGGIERRQGHYYRLQAPNFLVEYDNTQNDANHIHSVWRDPANDFGADILAQHYAHDH